MDAKNPKGRNGQAVALNYKVKDCKPKDMIGIPWMLAFSLRDSGWYLRNDITECPVCKTNMSECTGAVPEPEEPVEDAEVETPEEPESSSPNIALIIGIIALVGIGGGAYYYIKFVRGKKQKDEDLDFFDDEGYEEEPYINEDEEPVIADDEDDEAETKETEESI